MTELQVKAAALEEERRHNRATEQLSKDMNQAQIEHLKESDRYTEEHYVRADTAGLISANASAMNASANMLNAETNRKNYEMNYDIEYGWTGDTGYPSGMPLSAQKKNAELELLTLPEGTTLPAARYQKMLREAEIKKLDAETLNKNVSTAITVISGVKEALWGRTGIIPWIAAPTAYIVK